MLESYSDILTVEETGNILKISKKSVYKLIEKGEIYARKVGRVYRIPKQSVCDLIRGEGR